MNAARVVLVTSAGTPFGLEVVRALANDPAVQSVVAVHSGAGEPDRPSQARVITVHADADRQRDAHDLLYGIARQHAVDTVIHTGLYADPAGTSVAQLERSALSIRHLLAYAEQMPSIEHFVLCSRADIYHVGSTEPILIDEDQTLELSSRAAESVRLRAQCDLTVCAKIGLVRLRIAVLRFAEILAPGFGGTLYDYLSSRVCLRPLGYDPMLNVLSRDDAVRAVTLAALEHAQGVFNIAGKDSLPLSELVHRAGRIGIPMPGPVLSPLYKLRAQSLGTRFRYALERRRFHYGGILDGRRAQAAFGYVPEHAIRFEELFGFSDGS